jgi:hypothetical protein
MRRSRFAPFVPVSSCVNASNDREPLLRGGSRLPFTAAANNRANDPKFAWVCPGSSLKAEWKNVLKFPTI